jgi:16S rRNA (cytosine967-C5)-methyltransferase
MSQARQIALVILRQIEQKGLYTDIALDQGLKTANLADLDRSLTTELVYGIVRRKRSLDSLIDQLGKKSSQHQPPDLRRILYLGLYQLRYLEQIPASAAVHTSVELAKQNGFRSLAGVVNGILRQYERRREKNGDPLQLPTAIIPRLGILHSFPDWLIEQWLGEWGEEETSQLCQWFNQPAKIDLRVNPLKTSREALQIALQSVGVETQPLPYLPQALRLLTNRRPIPSLPGFAEGWFTVQDGSAQLVSHWLDPQPSEVIIDACAAPGGKTTHIAELMGDEGIIWASDRSSNRLKKVKENQERLQLKSIRIIPQDSRHNLEWQGMAERVLLDAPCSGLGTLHKRPDIRWRQNPESIRELVLLQQQLLTTCASWVKPKGFLVYSTCTLNIQENEEVVSNFLITHPGWEIIAPTPETAIAHFATPSGWLKVLPHRHALDGFFLVKLRKGL